MDGQSVSERMDGEGMRWYKHLYVGKKAKKKRFMIIQNIRNHRFQTGVHVITPPSCGSNVLDIYPAKVLLNDYYKKQEGLLILGIGADYDETLEVAGRIVSDMYRATGGFCTAAFLGRRSQET